MTHGPRVSHGNPEAFDLTDEGNPHLLHLQGLKKRSQNPNEFAELFHFSPI